MFRPIRITSLLCLYFVLPPCSAQAACYPAGGVAGIIIATFVVTVVLVGLSLAAAWRVRKRRKNSARRTDNHVTPEKISGDFAFDNPYFRDQEDDETETVEKGKTGTSPINKTALRSSKQSDMSTKGKKSRGIKGHHFIFGGGGGGKKQRAMDDSCLAVEPERTVVALRGHDFTGLGFNICGNMRDGILVKDVLHRGPASESGRIKAGDRILSVTVSFTNIVYEDALTILSYASPYDVQLELERIPDKSRAMQPSTPGSKRLGSCSFSSGGQKLFHPLYRSQSIDDLTQIGKDTFPMHGIGPRRSQSVGVAAHKLAAHFKNSDNGLEEKVRSPAAVVLSTTGSLNEKMLANVMVVEGALKKSGPHWEKRFEDTLESESSETNETSGLGDSKRVTPALTNQSRSLPKESISSVEGDRSDSSDDIISSHVPEKEDFRIVHTPAKRKAPQPLPSAGGNRCNLHSGNAIKTKAQVHPFEGLGGRMSKPVAEASNALWHLDQSIRDGDSGASVSDFDSGSAYHVGTGRYIEERCHSRAKGFSSSSSSSEAQHTVGAKKNAVPRRDADDDTDVSGDSLEIGDKKHRSKRSKRKSSSLGDLTQLEEAVNTATSGLGSRCISLENEAPKPVTSDKSAHKQKINKKSNKDSDSSVYNEKSNLNQSGYNNSWQSLEKARSSECIKDSHLNRISQTQSGASSVTHSNTKDLSLDCSINRGSSPKLAPKTAKNKSNYNHMEHKDQAYRKTEHYQQGVYTSSIGSQEKTLTNKKPIKNESPRSQRKLDERPSYSEKYELNSSRNSVQHYGSNNRNILSTDGGKNRCGLTSHHPNKFSQQMSSPVNYQQATIQSTPQEEAESRKADLESGIELHPQFLRTSANPGGMFTQINPFQQPSRQKGNATFKPWVVKDETKKDATRPVNGSATHVSVFPKPGQVTTCDSSGRQRLRKDNVGELTSYSQRTSDGGMSKTVIISTFDSNCGRSSLRLSSEDPTPITNCRLPRK